MISIIILAALYLGILLFKFFSARWVLNRAARAEPLTVNKSVTILQPILSGDPSLQDMLEANIIALPDAQFFWLIDEDDQTAASISQSLCQRYPLVDIKIMSFPAAPDGVNPKSFKLEHAWPKVDSEICLVLDDDAHLSSSSLASILQKTVGRCVVTALPQYRKNQHWSSAMLAQFVNDNAAFTYLPLLPFAEPLTINGMCYALRTDTLASLGGFAPILRHLTDDLAIATLAQQNDVRLIQLTAPVIVQTATLSGQQYFRQMHRWFLFAILLMRQKSLSLNLLIFILQGLGPLLLWGLVISSGQSVLSLLTSGADKSHAAIGLAICITTLLIRSLCIRQIQQQQLNPVAFHPWKSLLSELLQPFYLIYALCNRTIRWRTRRYRVFSNNRFISQ